MILTQDQLAAQMVAQLRVLDPSASAEVGTPERKIIDTVAQALAEAQVDLNLLGGSLDLDSKFASDLDAFVGLFGFGRQIGAFATGFVTFGRPTPSPYNITIPTGTQVLGVGTFQSPATGPPAPGPVVFQTTSAVTLIAGQTAVIAPIQAILAGSQGNLAANTITQFANVGAPVLGITTVINELPTANGADAETDPELKIRFRNTVFRNLAGTNDQYMALAVSTLFSTKANVIGPISRYTEYMQIPDVDDSETEFPVAYITADITANGSTLLNVTKTGGGTPEPGQLIGGQGLAADTKIIAIEGTTYTLSTTYPGAGGSQLLFVITTGQSADGPGNGNPGEWTTTTSNNPYAKYIYTNIPYFVSNGATAVDTIFYRHDTDFILNAPPIDAGDTYREAHELPPDLPDPADTPFNPNLTFFNVYEDSDTTVTLPRPSDIVLVEYSYMSAESRNDIVRNITNCVDVYVNGENPITANAIIPLPVPGMNVFSNNPTDKFYYYNFRRFQEPDNPPFIGHVFQGLFWQPTIGLPNQIVAGEYTYLLGTHYWLVEDKTLIGNTVRTRNGIEWDVLAHGVASADPDGGPYSGAPITDSKVQSLTIDGYTYDKNIIDLQVALDGSKQVTTDVLAHRATRRYFKLDLTIVYKTGVGIAGTNAAIQSTIVDYFERQYFGTTIQLSDILTIVRNVPGVQNVRWSQDIQSLVDANEFGSALHRVLECDIRGYPLNGATASQLAGAGVSTGSGTFGGTGSFGAGSGGFGMSVISTSATGSTTFAGSGTFGSNADLFGGSSFLVPQATEIFGGSGTFGGDGTFGQAKVYDTDFYLRDSELPSLPVGKLPTDTLPGLVLRPRAQNVFGFI